DLVEDPSEPGERLVDVGDLDCDVVDSDEPRHVRPERTAQRRESLLPMEIATVADRPELSEPAWELTKDVLPEYNDHGDVLNVYWPRLTEERAEFQFHLVGDDGEILARARTIPIRWNGTVEGLPAGIDGAMAGGSDEPGADVLCALVVMIPPALQGRGLSAEALRAMLEIARRHGLTGLVAPVRPSWKERYPLVPIGEYARWRRADGL